jgi:hypothetical protein
VQPEPSWVFAGGEYRDDADRLFPQPVTATYAHQLRLLSEAMAATQPLPATPAMDSDLSRVRGADVLRRVSGIVRCGGIRAAGDRRSARRSLKVVRIGDP